LALFIDAVTPQPGKNLRNAKAALAVSAELEQAFWLRWRNNKDAEARSELLDMHLPYAKVVAASYYSKRFNDEIEFDDYLQLASIGLIEAMERFDPAFGVGFRTFAARRMHGSILDGVEQLTEKQQQIGARQRLEAQRRDSLKELVDNSGTDAAQISRGATRSSDQVLRYVAEVGMAFALSWMLDGTGMIETGEAGATMPFYRSVELRELRERILELVNSLPSQERMVIQRHYLQELSFEEITKTLGVTKGRVSQIHRKALFDLRQIMLKQQVCDVSW
jgi:RNA polymerase sigma factor FliA